MICSILLAFVVDCTNPVWGVVFLTIGVGLLGIISSAGYGVNAIDIAGKYAGVFYGISNTLATIPGIVVPYLVGVITKNGTKEEWRIVFIIGAIVYLIGALPYIFWASGELEDWAKEIPDEIENKDIELIESKT